MNVKHIYPNIRKGEKGWEMLNIVTSNEFRFKMPDLPEYEFELSGMCFSLQHKRYIEYCAGKKYMLTNSRRQKEYVHIDEIRQYGKHKYAMLQRVLNMANNIRK
jgi:hypothetical protein